MSLLASQFSNNARTINLAVILLLTVVLIIGNPTVNHFLSRATIWGFYYPFFTLRESVTELAAVASENRRLRQRLADSELARAMLEEAGLENERLRSVLGFDRPAGYSLVPAKVMIVYGQPVPTTAAINRGADSAVTIDQTLINQQGLVGRVTEVSQDIATVQLLTDPANRVAARVVRSRQMGMVKYVPGMGLILDNFPVEGDIEEGDEIVSSGLGKGYPTGLDVGTVIEVVRRENEPFCDIRIRPAVDFNSLEELFLLGEESL